MTRAMTKHFVLPALALAVFAANAELIKTDPVPAPPLRQASMSWDDLERYCAPLSVDLLVYKSTSTGYRVERGAGTIIHEDGYILASCHATSHGLMQLAYVHDGKKLDPMKRGFRVVAMASDYDIALVKIEPYEGIRAAQLGRDSDTGVGQKVLMIGNPGGKSHTIHHAEVAQIHTEGGRMIVQGSDVNPGDSGGSVFNMRGQLIGMIQLKLIGLYMSGAALEMDLLRKGFEQVLADEKHHDYKLGLTVDMYGPARVTNVRPGSPASKAGIKLGDVIRMVGDMKIDDGMQYVCAACDIDSELPRIVKLERDGVTYAATVTPEGRQTLQNATDIKNLARGLNCSVYQGTWDKLPDFSSLTPESTRIVSEVGLRAAPASRNEFGLVFDGFIKIPADGKWTFYTKSDDGSKLWIGDTLVVQNDFLRETALEQIGTVLLEKGWHPIRLEYFDRAGAESVSLLMSGPATPKCEVPDSMLGHKP